MDELIYLLREFGELADNADEIVFVLQFTRVMYTILDLISEELFNARDLRDTNEFYELIYMDIIRLRRHFMEYLQAVQQREEEEF